MCVHILVHVDTDKHVCLSAPELVNLHLVVAA